MFTELRKQKFDKVTFMDSGHDNIFGIDKNGRNSTSSTKNVYLDDGLKYNMLSNSQLCDKGSYVWFDDS